MKSFHHYLEANRRGNRPYGRISLRVPDSPEEKVRQQEFQRAVEEFAKDHAKEIKAAQMKALGEDKWHEDVVEELTKKFGHELTKDAKAIISNASLWTWRNTIEEFNQANPIPQLKKLIATCRDPETADSNQAMNGDWEDIRRAVNAAKKAIDDGKLTKEEAIKMFEEYGRGGLAHDVDWYLKNELNKLMGK